MTDISMTPARPLSSSLAVAARSGLLAMACAATTALSAQTLPDPGRGIPGIPVQGAFLPDFSSLVERVGPAVVNVRTTQTARAARGEDAEWGDEERELFRRFFGVPPPSRPGAQPDRDGEGSPQVQRGVGSGFIVSADGHVLTNATSSMARTRFTSA